MCRCGQIRLRMVGHHVDQLARHFGRFDAGEPHAKIAGQLGDAPHEMRQPRPLLLRPAAVPVDAVMAQVNAGEHDFAIAVVDQPPHFVDDVLQRPAGELRPHVGDDAEAAPQQAAILHLHVGPMPAAETR